MEGYVDRSHSHPNFDHADSSAHCEPFELDLHPPSRRIRQIWAVGGGKGGVGKSLIASSLAISISQAGRRVVAVDLDLGGANLHTTLGLDLPRATLSDFLTSRAASIESCLLPTDINGLQVISGAQDSVSAANISDSEKVRLMRSLISLDTDYLILDLGAGTASHTMDFFLASDIPIVTLLPEPTSIENAYRFIRTAYYRHLACSRRIGEEAKALVRLAMDGKNSAGINTPSDLFREVSRRYPEAGIQLKKEIERFQPKVLVNQARTQNDIDIGTAVKTVCKRYFGIEVDYLGFLEHDNAVWQAVRRKRPVALEFPKSRLVLTLNSLAQKIMRAQHPAEPTIGAPFSTMTRAE